MPKKKKKKKKNLNASIIIFGIISMAALGLSLYTFFSPQSKDSSFKIVGIWDDLNQNMDYAPYTLETSWLVELKDNSYIDSNYINVINTGTRVTLAKTGWYRIQINMLLYDLTSPTVYRLVLLKNGVIESILVRYYSPSGVSTNHIHAQGFVQSDGDDYIEMRVYSDPSENFYLLQSPDLNQFSIEYLPN